MAPALHLCPTEIGSPNNERSKEDDEPERFAVLPALLAALLAFGACERAEQPEEAEEVATPMNSDVNKAEAMMAVDDVTVGSKLSADGSMETGSTGDEFGPGQTVYVAMEVGDATAGSEVRVVWYGPDGMELTSNRKQIAAGDHYINFSADTTGWAPGSYRGEVWYGDEMVNEFDFQIEGGQEGAEEATETDSTSPADSRRRRTGLSGRSGRGASGRRRGRRRSRPRPSRRRPGRRAR